MCFGVFKLIVLSFRFVFINYMIKNIVLWWFINKNKNKRMKINFIKKKDYRIYFKCSRIFGMGWKLFRYIVVVLWL